MLLIVTLLLAQFNVTAVTACTATPPSMGTPPTIADRVNAADIVLVGTVTDIVNPQGFEETANVRVEQYFKGAGTEQIEVMGFGESSTCRRYVEIGDKLLFYIQKQADGSLYAHWLTAGGAAVSPTDELIAEITTALNLPPNSVTLTPTSLSSTDKTATPEAVAIASPEPPPIKATSGSFLIWVYILATITLTMGIAFWHRRRTKGRQ